MLGANDGLITVASLMIGIGAIKEDISVMLLTGFAGLVAGACSMAIGEFVSVYTQYDIEIAQMKREREIRNTNNDEESNEKEILPNPFQAALASALAFSVGAVMPLLAAAFIKNHKIRMGVVFVVVSFALLVFGSMGALIGKTPVMRSCVRVLIGGWMAMAITFGVTKLIGTTGL
jgi:VIT1/CCC1 family predicted Fe2+/Mn2+ transporter